MKRIDDIIMPEGLGQRLSDSIDGWAGLEAYRRRRRNIIRMSGACVTGLAAIFGVFIFGNSNALQAEDNYVIADTYSDPQDAAKAVSYAMLMLSQTFDQGISGLEDVNESYGIMKNTEVTIN